MSTRNFFESDNNNIIEVDSSQHSETSKNKGTFGIKPTFDLSLSFDQQNTTEMEDQMAHVQPIATQDENDPFQV